MTTPAEILRFAVEESTLGSILIALSEKGICAILLGDESTALAVELQNRFPKAQLIAADEADQGLIAKVVAFVEKPTLQLSLNLDLRGTPFQQRVWLALRDILVGSTQSYTEIAKKIGRPTAVRAVAGACAANPLAVAIPCHRILRHNGELSGYRWGIERKRILLAREAK